MYLVYHLSLPVLKEWPCLGAQRRNLPDHQSKVLKGYPLCGLHVLSWSCDFHGVVMGGADQRLAVRPSCCHRALVGWAIAWSAMRPGQGAEVANILGWAHSLVLIGYMDNSEMMPARSNMSKVASDHINGAYQWLGPQEASQLVPTSLADASRLGSGSPSPVVHVLFTLVFLHWFLCYLSLCTSPLRMSFLFVEVL